MSKQHLFLFLLLTFKSFCLLDDATDFFYGELSYEQRKTAQIVTIPHNRFNCWYPYRVYYYGVGDG